MVPFPEPDEVTVHQAWSLDAVHTELDVTAKDVEPAVDGTSWFAGVTASVGKTVVVNCRSLP